MQLSNQAIGAVMIALQKSLMEQSDITPVLQEFVLVETDNGLVVENPPIIEINENVLEESADEEIIPEENDAEV